MLHPRFRVQIKNRRITIGNDLTMRLTVVKRSRIDRRHIDLEWRVVFAHDLHDVVNRQSLGGEKIAPLPLKS